MFPSTPYYHHFAPQSSLYRSLGVSLRRGAWVVETSVGGGSRLSMELVDGQARSYGEVGAKVLGLTLPKSYPPTHYLYTSLPDVTIDKVKYEEETKTLELKGFYVSDGIKLTLKSLIEYKAGEDQMHMTTMVYGAIRRLPDTLQPHGFFHNVFYPTMAESKYNSSDVASALKELNKVDLPQKMKQGLANMIIFADGSGSAQAALEEEVKRDLRREGGGKEVRRGVQRRNGGR